MRNKWLWIIILIFVLGGFSGVLFNRFVIPYLAGLPGLSGLHKLESSNPVIINRHEEVQLNEGANYQDLSRQASAYTVSIYSQDNGVYKFLGNGIIASADGMILASKTNLPPAGSLTVLTNDGTAHTAAIRALDPKSEIAVITIDANNLPFAQFADAFDLIPSQKLIYTGRSNKEFVREFALGMVTVPVANQANPNTVYSTETFVGSFTTDAKVSADFVGGPIINLDGKVVGMTSSGLSAVTGEQLSSAVSSYLSGGKILRPDFVIKYQNLSDSLGHLKGLPQGGILVVGVDEASPAKTAGILAGDLITSINNQPLPQSNFEKILNQQATGDLPLVVLRNGQQVNLTVKLAAK